MSYDYYKSKAPSGMGAVFVCPSPITLLPIQYLSIDAAHNSKGITEPDRFIKQGQEAIQNDVQASKIRNTSNLSDQEIQERLNAFYRRLELKTDLSEEEIQNRVIEYKNYLEHL